MRLPQPLLDSQFFQFSSLAELLKATGELVPPSEQVQMRRMVDRGLPPITSRAALSAMLGINPGFTHAFITWPQRYYRTFEIPKGRRGILPTDAPRVGLKIIQKWVAERLQNCYERPEHVYGFVPGLSHVHAAAQHCDMTWTFGVDIKDFFQTTPIKAAGSASCESALTRTGPVLSRACAVLTAFLRRALLPAQCFRTSASCTSTRDSLSSQPSLEFV